MENPGFLSEFQNSPDIQILLDMIHGKTSLTSDDLLEMLTMVDPVNTQDRIQVPDTFSLSPRRWLCLLVSASTCFHFLLFYDMFLFSFYIHCWKAMVGLASFYLRNKTDSGFPTMFYNRVLLISLWVQFISLLFHEILFSHFHAVRNF